jgi:hypothetical protein
LPATTVRPPAFLPRTFLEWGVAVPFTTPMLGSGRIRPGRRGKAELLLPNPSGGRGLYVIDLGAAPEVTSLTLHDRLLVERLLELAAPTPSEIRKAARQLALDGAAGRRAAREADIAAASDATAGLMIQLHLVTRLLQEAGLASIDWRRFLGDNRELRATIRSHLAGVAPGLGLSVDGVFQSIEEIADIAMPVGTRGEEGQSRNEAMLARLRTFTLSLGQWATGDASAGDANAIRQMADRTLGEAAASQAEARDLLDGPAPLLRHWHDRLGERMRNILTRPEWLLDGWAQLCGQWEAVARDDRPVQREALQQIRAALPMLDPNDRDARGMPVGNDIRFDRGRRVRLHEDWRTGASLLDSHMRAELLRAATA